MTRSRLGLCALAASLVACAPAGPMAPVDAPASGLAAPTAGPSGLPSSSPLPGGGPSGAPSATPSPLGEALVRGAIFGLEGGQLEQATMVVQSANHPELNGTRSVPGVFSFRAPVGAQLRLTVEAAGHSSRTRALVVRAPDPLEGERNVVDFGGPSPEGQLHALVRYPEIARTIPEHGSTGLTTQPLRITLVMSRPIPEDQRGLLRRLVVLDLGNSNQVVAGTSYNDQRAELDWNASGTEAVFSFGAPLVTRLGASSSVRLGFDTAVQESSWPRDGAGFSLGFKKVVDARDGNGQTAPSQVAPLLSTRFPPPPAGRLSPEALWALTHAVSAQFSLAPDATQPRVVSVRAIPKALSDGRGEIYVRFSEAMRAFPEAALDGSAIRPSAYRLVLGTTKDRDPREEFEAADPSKGGIGPSEVLYDPLHPETIVLRTAAGVLERYTDYKLFVSPSVHDPAGNAVLADVDASTGRPANLIVGKVE